MKDLRVWFALWLTAMVVLVALPAEGRTGRPLYAGRCVDGMPVIDHWDTTLQIEFEPACRSGVLTLRPAGGKEKPLAPPEDFADWAFVRLNGQRLHNPYHDAYPYVTGTTGEVRVPLRLVAEAMGGEVTWEAGAQQVELARGGRTTTLTIGSTAAIVDGQSVTLDEAPVLWLDRTLVTPAVIARLFDAQVSWDPDTSQIMIRRAGTFCSPDFCMKAT